MRGFGLIEILIVLVLILGLSLTYIKVLRKEEGAARGASVTLEENLRADLERTKGLSLTEFRTDAVAGKNQTRNFRYELGGMRPNQEVTGFADGRATPLARSVVFFRLTAFSANGAFIPDNLQGPDLQKVARIRVEFAVHDEKERPELLLNDGIHGIDLDGDPTNGVAPVHERSFGLMLSQ